MIKWTTETPTEDGLYLLFRRIVWAGAVANVPTYKENLVQLVQVWRNDSKRGKYRGEMMLCFCRESGYWPKKNSRPLQFMVVPDSKFATLIGVQWAKVQSPAEFADIRPSEVEKV